MKAKCIEQRDKNYKRYNSETVIEILSDVINGRTWNTEETEITHEDAKAVSNTFKLKSGEFVKIKVAKTESDLY
jgi:hypothetical protein